MTIQRTKKELVIRLPLGINIESLQNLIDLIRYKELISKSKAKQKDIDKLADDIKEEWWLKNKKRFFK